MRMLSAFIFSVIIFFSCSKKEDAESPAKLFFEKERKVLQSESFDQGQASSDVDTALYTEINSLAFVQNGPCASIVPGYFTLGCVPPLIYQDSMDWNKNYELQYVSKFFDFGSKYLFENFASNSIGIQIDFQNGGITEINYHGYVLKEARNNPVPDMKTLHVKIDVIKKTYQVFVNYFDVSEGYELMPAESELDGIEFKDKNAILNMNGVNYLNHGGVRIGFIEIYAL